MTTRKYWCRWNDASIYAVAQIPQIFRVSWRIVRRCCRPDCAAFAADHRNTFDLAAAHCDDRRLFVSTKRARTKFDGSHVVMLQPTGIRPRKTAQDERYGGGLCPRITDADA